MQNLWNVGSVCLYPMSCLAFSNVFEDCGGDNKQQNLNLKPLNFKLLFIFFFSLCFWLGNAITLARSLFKDFSQRYTRIYFLQADRKTFWNQHGFITHPACDLISSCNGWPLWNIMERAELENVHFKVLETLVQCTPLLQTVQLVTDIWEFQISLTGGCKTYYSNF